MVRFADNNDFDFVKKSWSVCFDDPPEFVDWNFTSNYSPASTVIAETNGAPASVMQLMPYVMNISDARFDTRYISGVATMPEHRGQGLVRAMFNFALPEMYKLGTLVSILVPAVSGMYEKFGYRTICERTFYSVTGTDDFEVKRTLSAKLIEILDRIYRKEMCKKSVFIDRSQNDWERILTDLLILSKGSVLLNCADNLYTGYALVYPKGDILEATEICGDIAADKVPVSAPPVMARVINARGVLEKLGSDKLCNFSIADDFIPQNNINPTAHKRLDISDLTEIIFKDCPNGTYINLLL